LWGESRAQERRAGTQNPVNDAGFVSLTKEQAKEVITTLQHFV
jgi:hypothetical protein